MTLREAIREYILDCESRNLSTTTVTWYRSKLRAFRKFLEQSEGPNDINDIRARHIREFLRSLKPDPDDADETTKPLSGHTHAGYVQVLRGFFNFLFEEELIETNPTKNIQRIRRPQTQIEPFSEDEVYRMLAVYSSRSSYVEHRNYVILLCLYDTGIRLRELTNLKIEDVDLAAYTISVVQGKWSKDRKIPIGKILGRELREYIPRRNEALERLGRVDKGYLFASTRGGALSPSAVYRGVVRAAGEAAGIQGKRVSPHTWRHTSALHYVLHGGDSFSLQARLGHSTMDMARHYVNLAFRDVQMLHRRYSPLDRLDG